METCSAGYAHLPMGETIDIGLCMWDDKIIHQKIEIILYNSCMIYYLQPLLFQYSTRIQIIYYYNATSFWKNYSNYVRQF